jgi:hypothetical protein
MAGVISLVRTAMGKEENQMEMNVLIVVELEEKDALIVLEREVNSVINAGEMGNLNVKIAMEWVKRIAVHVTQKAN